MESTHAAHEGDNTVGASAGVRYWPYRSSCIIRTADGVKQDYKDAVKDETAVTTRLTWLCT